MPYQRKSHFSRNECYHLRTRRSSALTRNRRTTNSPTRRQRQKRSMRTRRRRKMMGGTNEYIEVEMLQNPGYRGRFKSPQKIHCVSDGETIQLYKPLELLSKDLRQGLQQIDQNEKILTLNYTQNGIFKSKKVLRLQFNKSSEAESWKKKFKQLIEQPISQIDAKIRLIPYKELVFICKVGQGASGTVYKGKWTKKERNIPVALKKITVSPFNISKKDVYNEIIDEINREASTLANPDLEHPNIVKFYGMSITTIDNSQIFILCTELLDSSLNDMLDSQTLTLEQKLYISLEIAKGLNHLHAKDYVHRDLKPANVCVNYTKDKDLKITAVKIIDCGFSRKVYPNPGDRKMTACLGTPIYMAPELLVEGNTEYDESVDIYSFGIMLWAIMYERSPYSDDEYKLFDQFSLISKIRDEGNRPSDTPCFKTVEHNPTIPSAIKQLYKRCWVSVHDHYLLLRINGSEQHMINVSNAKTSAELAQNLKQTINLPGFSVRTATENNNTLRFEYNQQFSIKTSNQQIASALDIHPNFVYYSTVDRLTPQSFIKECETNIATLTSRPTAQELQQELQDIYNEELQKAEKGNEGKQSTDEKGQQVMKNIGTLYQKTEQQ